MKTQEPGRWPFKIRALVPSQRDSLACGHEVGWRMFRINWSRRRHLACRINHLGTNCFPETHIPVRGESLSPSATHPESELELEGRPLEERSAGVVAAEGEAVRARLLDVHAVDGLAVAVEVPDRGAGVPQEHGAEPQEENHKRDVVEGLFLQVSPGRHKNKSICRILHHADGLKYQFIYF